MNLDGSGNKTYRVLKCKDSVAEVMGMNDINTNFGNNNTYNGSNLDVALNTTYYNTLSTETKAAIIPKNIIQYEYTASGSSSISLAYWGNADYSTKAVKENIGERYIYALDIEDIFEGYLEGKACELDPTTGTVNMDPMKILFSNNTGSIPEIWLRSAVAAGDFSAYAVNNSGFIEGGRPSEHLWATSEVLNTRPVFQIDLSKIPFTKTTEVIS